MDNYWSKFTNRRLRRRRLLQSGATLSLGAAALNLVGCGDDDDGEPSGGSTSEAGAGATPTTGAGQAEQPRQGGVFGYVAGSAAPNMNVVNTWGQGHQLAGVNVYDRPLSSRISRDWVLEAAESIETPEPTQVVVTFRQGMTFHDIAPVNGRAFSVQDVVASQEYVKASPQAENDFQRNITDHLETPDDRTVVFHLQRPSAFLYSSGLMGHPGSMAIIPQEILEDLDSHHPIGSGPYYAGDFTIGAEYHYLRFDGFRQANDGLPYVDERIALALTDQVALETAFRGERVHVWEPTPGNAERVAGDMGDRVEIDTWLAVNPFTFNLCMKESLPWKNDVRIREGFYRVIDKQQYVSLGFLDKAVVPTSFLSAAYEDYLLDASQTEEFFRTDPAEARKLFEAANFQVDQQYELMMGQSALSATNAEIFAEQASQAGLNIRPQPYPTSEFLAKSQAGDWEMFIGGHPAYEVNIPIRQAGHRDSRSQFANTGLGDPDIEAMIEKAEQTLDRDEHNALVKELQLELLRRYTGYYLLVTRTIEQLRWAKVRNFEIDPGASNAGLLRQDLWIDA